MKNILLICLCLAFAKAELSTAQNQNAIKYGRFSDPIIPIFRYQDLNVSKQPSKISERTFNWDRLKKKWIKAEDIVYKINDLGYVTNKTTTSFSTEKEIVNRNIEMVYTYENGMPARVVSTTKNMFYNQAKSDQLEFIFGKEKLNSLVKTGDTLKIDGSQIIGKSTIVNYDEGVNTIMITHQDKTSIFLNKNYYFMSYGESLKPVFDYSSDSRIINLYMPDNPAFFLPYLSDNLNVDVQSLNQAITKNLESYKQLVASRFNSKSKLNKDHLNYKYGINSNWVAILNQKNTFYDATTLTVRKILYPNNTVEGNLDLDLAFIKSLD
jgi:RNase P/RNase MRP subunit p29